MLAQLSSNALLKKQREFGEGFKMLIPSQA